MHELYLAQCIVRSVKKVLPEHVAAEHVTEVRVKVGKLDAVVPENLAYLFSALRVEEGLPNAFLTLEEEDVKCRCKVCGEVFDVITPIFSCTSCGMTHVEVIEGRGLTILDFMISDEEPEYAHPDS